MHSMFFMNLGDRRFVSWTKLDTLYELMNVRIQDFGKRTSEN